MSRLFINRTKSDLICYPFIIRQNLYVNHAVSSGTGEILSIILLDLYTEQSDLTVFYSKTTYSISHVLYNDTVPADAPCACLSSVLCT